VRTRAFTASLHMTENDRTREPGVSHQHPKSGVTQHHHVVDGQGFHRGLLKKGTRFRMSVEVDLVGG
jgi:hypothetical protein